MERVFKSLNGFDSFLIHGKITMSVCLGLQVNSNCYALYA